MNLVTPYEVIKYSGAGRDYPTTQFCDLIPQIEQEFTRECLGQELYDYILSKMAAYPMGAQEWNSTTTYAIDQTVIRNGCLFVSQINSNASDPLAETGDWAAFERFTDAGVMLLWTGYLRRILSLKVYSSSITPTTWRSNAGGVVVNAGDGQGFRSGNKTEIETIKSGILTEVERTTGNMIYWLQKNGTENNLPLPSVCNTECQTRGRQSRRWMFKN